MESTSYYFSVQIQVSKWMENRMTQITSVALKYLPQANRKMWHTSHTHPNQIRVYEIAYSANEWIELHYSSLHGYAFCIQRVEAKER